MARWGSRKTSKEAAAAATLSSFFSGGSSSGTSSVKEPSRRGDGKSFHSMTLGERWAAALDRQKTNSMPEWICAKCHATNFVKKHVCRGCQHAKGWLLPPRGDAPQGPAQAVATLLNHPAVRPSSPPVPAGGGKKANTPPARQGKHPGVPSGSPATSNDKSEETKLLQLKQQLMAEHLCTTEIDNRLDALRAARAPVVKPPAQALVMATNAHRKATTAREKMQSTVAMLQKQLTEALQQLETCHTEEAAAAIEVEAASCGCTQCPTAPGVCASEHCEEPSQRIEQSHRGALCGSAHRCIGGYYGKGMGVPLQPCLCASPWHAICFCYPGSPCRERQIGARSRSRQPPGACHPVRRNAGGDLRGLSWQPQRCEYVRGVMSWCPGQPLPPLRSVRHDVGQLRCSSAPASAEHSWWPNIALPYLQDCPCMAAFLMQMQPTFCSRLLPSTCALLMRK